MAIASRTSPACSKPMPTAGPTMTRQRRWRMIDGDKAGVRALVEALAGGRCRLASLDLAYNNLRCSGCAILLRTIMSERCPLQELTLEKNDIGEDGAQKLVNVLATNRGLKNHAHGQHHRERRRRAGKGRKGRRV